MQFSAVSRFVVGIFKDVHRKQADSLATFVFAALFAKRVGVAEIGKQLAKRLGKIPKHAINQFDRFLRNPKFVVLDAMTAWARAIASGKGRILLALDWTEFANDGHHVLMISRVHRDGRVIPMMWRTVDSDQLEGNMKAIERQLLADLRRCLPCRCEAIVLADRGFGDVAFYQYLRELGYRFVIRYRGGIFMRADIGQGKSRLFVPTNGRARRCDDCDIGIRGDGFAHVVLVKKRGMKDAWCLATDLPDHPDIIVVLYSRRFWCEETHRDIKDPRFGFGLSACSIARTDRRDRMLLVLAMASFVLTVVGKLAEHLGLDRLLRVHSVERRDHSLFTQGRYFVDALRERIRPPYLRELHKRIKNISLRNMAYAA